jgi:hypothetical protein
MEMRDARGVLQDTDNQPLILEAIKQQTEKDDLAAELDDWWGSVDIRRVRYAINVYGGSLLDNYDYSIALHRCNRLPDGTHIINTRTVDGFAVVNGKQLVEYIKG